MGKIVQKDSDPLIKDDFDTYRRKIKERSTVKEELTIIDRSYINNNIFVVVQHSHDLKYVIVDCFAFKRILIRDVGSSERERIKSKVLKGQ